MVQMKREDEIMDCPMCGNELRRSKKDANYGLCDNCKKKIKWVEDDFEDDYEVYESVPQNSPLRRNAIRCPKCGGENVSIEMMQTGGKTKKHGNGLGGHVNNAARGIAAVSTLGMSNLLWKKSKGNEKTAFKNQKVCLCQDCGKSWNIK